MTTEYYDHTTYPANGAVGSASAMRTELESIETGFSKLPTLAGNGGEIIAVNSGATALEAITTTGTGSGVRATSPSIASPTLTGTPVAPTAAAGTGGTQIATCGFVAATSLVSALPGQTGNSGKFVTTDGTNASWDVPTPGNHEVVVHTGNGHGSTNTKIRRFTTAMTNTGTAITYADSAANGASFTINADGLYSIHYTDTYSGGTAYLGVSVNSAELTTSVASIAIADRIGIAFGAANEVVPVARVARLASGDVVRPHTAGSQDGVGTLVFFAIRKVSDQ